MRYSLIGLATGAVLAAFSSVAPAQANGCSIKDLKLDCGEGSVMERAAMFAAKETTDALRYPWFDVDKFSRPQDLENFRRSFETEWKSVNKAAQLQNRNLKRRRISNEEFEAWKTTYDSARENYDRAMFYYRTLVWNGKTGRPARSE